MARKSSSRRSFALSAVGALLLAGSAAAQNLENGIGVIAPVPFALSGQTYRPGDQIPLQVSTVFNDVFDTEGNGVLNPIVINAEIWATQNINVGSWKPTELTVGRTWTVPDGVFRNETMIYTLFFSGPSLFYNCPKPATLANCKTAEGTSGSVDIAISGERLAPSTTSRAATTTRATTSAAATRTTSSAAAPTTTQAPRPTTTSEVAATTTSVPQAIPAGAGKMVPATIAAMLGLLFAVAMF